MSRLRPLTIMCWRKTPSNVKPRRSAARHERILRVALPLEAAVAEVVERVSGEQEDRLGGRRRTLERAQRDVADLDHAVLRLDPQVARLTLGTPSATTAKKSGSVDASASANQRSHSGCSNGP